MRHRKSKIDQAARMTISMPMAMYIRAVGRQQDRGLNSFSAYVQTLVHSDQPDPHQPTDQVKEAA